MEIWEGFAGLFGDIEWVIEVMALPPIVLGIGYRFVGGSFDFDSHAGINVRRNVLGLFVASGMAVDLASSTQQPEARPEDRSRNRYPLPDDRPRRHSDA